MYKFYLRVLVYFICFFFSLYGLSAFDFNRFIKKNHVASSWVLYFIIAFSLAYLCGSFIMAVIYYFY